MVSGLMLSFGAMVSWAAIGWFGIWGASLAQAIKKKGKKRKMEKQLR
jgi:hypothetical protein